MTSHRQAALDELARHTAAQVKCTLRRWWLDPHDKELLHVEVERTLVGARPVIVAIPVPMGTKETAPPVATTSAPTRSTRARSASLTHTSTAKRTGMVNTAGKRQSTALSRR